MYAELADVFVHLFEGVVAELNLQFLERGPGPYAGDGAGVFPTVKLVLRAEAQRNQYFSEFSKEIIDRYRLGAVIFKKNVLPGRAIFQFFQRRAEGDRNRDILLFFILRNF